MSLELLDKEREILTTISKCYYKIFSREETARVSKYMKNGSWEYKDTKNNYIFSQEEALEILTQQAWG